MRLAISRTTHKEQNAASFLLDVVHSIPDHLVDWAINVHVLVKCVKLFSALDGLLGTLTEPSEYFYECSIFHITLFPQMRIY